MTSVLFSKQGVSHGSAARLLIRCVDPLRRPECLFVRFDMMSEVDNNVAPPIGADDEPAPPVKARSRSPSIVTAPEPEQLGAGEGRRKRRSSSRGQPPDEAPQAQAFNLSPEQRGRPGVRVRQGTPVPSPAPAGTVTPPGAGLFAGLDGNPSSPGPEAPQEELRQWSVRMFAQHEQILRDVFTRVAMPEVPVALLLPSP